MTSLREVESGYQDIVSAIAKRDAPGIEQAAARMQVVLERMRNAAPSTVTGAEAQRAVALRAQIAATRMHIKMLSHVMQRQVDAIAHLNGHQTAIGYRRA